MESRTSTPLITSAVRVGLGAALILLIPFVAMRVTTEVSWTLLDFVVAGTLLCAAGLTLEFLARRAQGHLAYTAASTVAVMAALVLVWANLAVGIIGSAGNPQSLMYFGVPAVGVVGAMLARLRARGMALATLAMACAVALITTSVLVPGQGPLGGDPTNILLASGVFVVLFAGSAWLYWKAAQLGCGQEGHSTGATDP